MTLAIFALQKCLLGCPQTRWRFWPRRHKLRWLPLARMARSPPAPLCLLSPQNHRFCGDPIQQKLPLSAAPALPLLGLVFPPVRQAEQMIHVALDSHQLSHLPLGFPVLGIKGFLPLSQFPAGFFEHVHLW